MARLRMTNADYVAIAVSPALVMALIGSLVFFLVQVFYVGAFTVRLNSVLALFVFATVLIARIAIEMGSERAAAFSMPLGILVFIAMGTFVEHPGPFSWLINLGLMTVIWWSAHKLTWDCTVIDDNQDSSGEGLLGRVGFDPPEAAATTAPAAAASSTSKSKQPKGGPPAANELFNDPAEGEAKPTLWQRIASAGSGPHTPGLWVLYFSLAALPLFGIGQSWIPASDVDRRRYAFGLLAVYVAAGLSLLVTTSFLGLRRYLRQRNVEMPAPMAVTWVSLGAVLILVVMFAAALLPRPSAEYALAKPPWQVGSPGDNSSNRMSVGNEGTVDPDADQRVTSDNQAQAPQTGEASVDSQSDQMAPGEEGGKKGESNESSGESASRDSSAEGESTPAGEQSSEESSSSERSEGNASGEANRAEEAADGGEGQPPSAEQRAGEGSDAGETAPAKPQAAEQGVMEPQAPQAPSMPDVSAMLQTLTGSIGAVLKLLLYAALAVGIAYFAWRRWPAIVQAFKEIMQMLRDLLARLFGGKPSGIGAAEEEAAGAAAIPRRTFAEFTDPFLSGRDRQASPVELVRYTFEAFEAWSGDRGQPRSLDQTPQEFLRLAAPPASPLHEEARRMVRLYSEAAYASGKVSREAAAGLRQLWHLMQSVR